MGTHLIRMPDVGEGVAEAELVEWHVKVGDPIREDMVIAAVMTDKATVEIPSPVDGTIAWLGGDIGDRIAVGAALVRIEVEGAGNEAPGTAAAAASAPSPAGPTDGASEADTAPEAEREAASPPPAASLRDTGAAPASTSSAPVGMPVPASGSAPAYAAAPRREGERPIAAPSVRARARAAGIDLRFVSGTGPAGRITHDDLEAHIAGRGRPGQGAQAGGAMRLPDTRVTEMKVVGLRRRISEKMALANARIPHITYVEEVECDALEEARAALNAGRSATRPKLTILPFLVMAMVRAIRDHPHLNAHFDDEARIVRQHGGVHVGIAAQTPNGLVVPVLKHAEALDLWGIAGEIQRLAEAAKSGTATREELTGSTITITSLGALGGIVTTPVINHPEVAIVGVNRMRVQPIWDGTAFRPKRVMNLSSSFDHRVVDGFDAAVFIQRIKALLEAPTAIFVES